MYYTKDKPTDLPKNYKVTSISSDDFIKLKKEKAQSSTESKKTSSGIRNFIVRPANSFVAGTLVSAGIDRLLDGAPKANWPSAYRSGGIWAGAGLGIGAIVHSRNKKKLNNELDRLETSLDLSKSKLPKELYRIEKLPL